MHVPLAEGQGRRDGEPISVDIKVRRVIRLKQKNFDKKAQEEEPNERPRHFINPRGF